MTMGSYNSEITDKALVLKDIFGSKEIPWNSIVSMSTQSTEGDIMFAIITSDKTYHVNRARGYSVESFGDCVAKKSNLEVSVAAWPTRMKRWAKMGTNYKHANYFDKLADSYYGIRSKEGMLFGYIAWAGFIIVVIIFILLLLGKL